MNQPGSIVNGRTVRSRAKVIVAETVDGTVKRRPRNLPAAPKAGRLTSLTVDARVMEAAKAALRPGERLVIVNETEVRLVPNN